MTVITVSKSMKVENPVGFVNIHPLPDLPAGLIRAHLTRRSLSAVNRNLADGTTSNFEEKVEAGSVGYEETYITTTHRRAGWLDPDVELNYDEGFTFLAVGAVDPEAGNNRVAYLCTREFSSEGFGERIDIEPNRVRFRAWRESGSFNQAASYSEMSSGFVAAFGGIDVQSDNVFAYAPHEDSYEEVDGEAPSPQAPAGLVLSAAYIAPGSAEGQDEESSKQAFAAVWDRPLSQSEMQQAYQALKPWLSRLGVNIA